MNQRVILTEHAIAEAARRGISEATILEVATTPEQRIPAHADREVRQSRVTDPASGRLQLMRVNYDARTDTLTVIFRDVPVAESDEEKPGVILDYDAAGNIVSIEVLDASRRVEEPGRVTVHTEG